MGHYLKHSKTGREFRVMGIDAEKGEITLKGKYAEFKEPYDKKRFKENGYVLVEHEDVEETEDETEDA